MTVMFQRSSVKMEYSVKQFCCHTVINLFKKSEIIQVKYNRSMNIHDQSLRSVYMPWACIFHQSFQTVTYCTLCMIQSYCLHTSVEKIKKNSVLKYYLQMSQLFQHVNIWRLKTRGTWSKNFLQLSSVLLTSCFKFLCMYVVITESPTAYHYIGNYAFNKPLWHLLL